MKISIKTRWEIVFLSKHRKGPRMSKSAIAKEVKCDVKTVRHWLKIYEDTGDIEEKSRLGRQRQTSAKEEDKIITIAEQHREEGSSKVAGRLKRKGVSIGTRTVRRRLEEAGLRMLPPLQKPLLTVAHREKRLHWARMNGETDWNQVIFTDEVTFKLFQNPYLARRRIGERIVYPTVKHSAKVHARGCFSSKGFGKLFLFTKNLDAKYMCTIYEKALLPSASSWFKNDPTGWLLLEDNDPKHSSRKAKQWKEENEIDRMDFPAYSPDLNPIQNVWKVMKANVAQQHPKTIQGLKKAIKKCWSQLDDSFAIKLASSMKNRIQELLDAEGDHTMY